MKLFHDPKVKTITFLDERYYFCEKTQAYYPSATTILDVYPKGYGFYKWLKDLGSNADKVLKEAGDRGTKIHDAIKNFLNGEEIVWQEEGKPEPNYSLDEWMMLMRFFEFYQKYKPESMAIEIGLVDSELGYGGTIDFIGKINGQVWLVDWKSSNAVYRSYELQVAAYHKLWNKVEALKIDRIGILHLNATTKGEGRGGVIQGKGWKLHEPKETPEELYSFFNMTRQIWLKENPECKPKNMVYPDRISINKKEEKDGNSKS